MPSGPRPKPQSERKRANAPTHEWKKAPGHGWQHGDVPEAPDGLKAASEQAWKTWMGAWFAGYWSEDDLPGLRTLIRLYDQVERGEFQRAGELRLQMDTYGITPKGQQDRRWTPELADEPKAATKKAGGRYSHLRAVSE